MSNAKKVDMATEEKREKARNLRYKKSIAEGFNLQEIQDELWEISEACSDVRWCADGDIDELIEALDGDEEEAFEFRVMFSELAGEAERLADMLDDYYIIDYFDDFFAAVAGGATRLLGFDSFEDDYYAMTHFEEDRAQGEASKRFARLTKQDIIQAARKCFGVAAAILNIRYKYDYLKASIDVIKGKNHAFLEIVKDIEKRYEGANAAEWYKYDKRVRDFDNAINAPLERAWVE